MINMNGLLIPCPLTRFKLGGKSERRKMFQFLHQAGGVHFAQWGSVKVVDQIMKFIFFLPLKKSFFCKSICRIWKYGKRVKSFVAQLDAFIALHCFAQPTFILLHLPHCS